MTLINKHVEDIINISLPIYHKIWWEGDFNSDGTATMRLMAFNGKENIVLEIHENVKVTWS